MVVGGALSQRRSGAASSPPPTRSTFPSAQPVRFKLIGGDVIHSFWVPALAGKTDAHPRPDQRDLARGARARHLSRPVHRILRRCSTPTWRLLVIADAPRGFRRLAGASTAIAAAGHGGAAQAGQAHFIAHCGACHAVRGTDAAGMLGPDLSHLMQRRTLAAGIAAQRPRAISRAGSPIRKASSPAT